MSGEQREKFCQEYIANGGDATAAYDVAFPSKKGRKNAATRVAACRLMKDPEILARIDALKDVALAHLAAETEEKTATTVETINAQLVEAFVLAKSEKNPTAMVNASMGQAKLLGFLVEKHDHKHTLDITPDEARSFIAQMAQKYLGKAGGA